MVISHLLSTLPAVTIGAAAFAVPEPATIVLLALATLVTFARRRRRP